MSDSFPARPGGASSLGPVLFAIVALALVLRVVALGTQPLLLDDIDVGKTARNFVDLGWPNPTMWNHPHLRDLLVRFSLDWLGDGPWGLRLWSVVLGTLAVPATALLVLSLTSSLRAAVVASLIVATDPLHVDFSRQAINDVYLSFFPVVAVLTLLRYRTVRRPVWLVLAGLMLGLGVASKWSAAFPVAIASAAILLALLRSTPDQRDRGVELALFASCLVLLPLAVYVLSYWPWFGRGHDLAEFIRLNANMAHETATHVGYPGTKLPGYPGEVIGAWRWFVQPIWYVDYLPPMPGREAPSGGFFLSGVANPLTWLVTLPAAGWAATRWLRERDSTAGWLLLLLSGAYLPFVLVPRPIWTNSAVAIVPFSGALVGWAAARLHERFGTPVRVWAGCALLLAALLWPPAAGISTRPTDAVLQSLVSRDALDPAMHLNQ